MNDRKSFEDVANLKKKRGPLSDLWFFMSQNKKFWLLPFVIIFLLLGFLLMLAGTGAAPFIYTVF